MSLRSKRTSRPGVYTSTGFSSMSVGSYSIPKMSTSTNQAITAVTINRSLLAPLNIDIDPNIQVVRTQEKEEIKTLNNRFVSFIDKVRYLEQQNKMLETKWKMLENKTPATSNIEPMMKAYIASLQKQLDFLNNDKHRLEMENEGMHKLVNDFKTKYEDETNKRNEAEQEFVMLKKDVDAGYLSKMELDDNVASINEEFQFLTSLYDAELRELQENTKETNVVVQMDNSRALNMEQIVADVKAQYEIIATRSRTEAENWYKTKFDKMTAEADQYGNELRSTKSEIAELTRIIARRKNEIEVVKAQRATLESQITEAEARGDAAIKDANNRIRDLEQALQRSKQDMARQVREYQEVMNIKLALDIEISTYRKMLEGEEKRLVQDTVVNIQTVSPRTHSVRKLEKRLSGPIVIKTMETNNVTYKNY